MAPRQRLLWFGSAGVLVVVGVLCAVFVTGVTGDALAFVFLALGLALAVLLVFYEVGLSEDRELAREEARRARDDARRAKRAGARRRLQRQRWRRRPG